MDRLARFLFSMRMMAVGMVIFLVAIAWATFLESNHDTQTAKIIVYNALWFEVLLAYLCVNLIANIFSHRMYQRSKIAVLMFHLAFIVMIIGAAITRFVGFEGMMMVREGATSNFIYTADPYFWFTASDGTTEAKPMAKKMYLSEITDNYFKFELENFEGRKSPITIEYVDFRKRLIDSLVMNDSIRSVSLEIVTDGMNSQYVSEGGFLMLGQNALSFEKSDAMPGIQVFKKGPQILVRSVQPMRSLPMAQLQAAARNGGVADSMYRQIPADSLVPFETTTLYQVGDQQFVFKQVINNSKMMKVSSGRKDVGEDCLTIKITDGEKSKLVDLPGGFGAIPEHVVFAFNGINYQMEYGSMRLQVPFSIRCNDFQLDKYPGSDSPSSFASEVTIIDEEMGVTKNKRIFMNNVMDYRGYRFFQSGYDPDELGTRLSVSHDWWGTNISYLGYLMMGIGLVLSLIAPGGRFRELNAKIKKSRLNKVGMLLIPIMMLSSWVNAQNEEDHSGHEHHQHQTQQAQEPSEPIYRVMSEEHSDKLASLLVQDYQGRIAPFHTICDQILRKLSRSSNYGELNAVQTVMSMHMYQGYWVRQPIIYVSGKSELREKLGMKGSMISYADLTNKETGQFVLTEEYNKAHQKFESKRNEFDKRLLQLGERYQVMGMIFRWDYMQLVPVAGAENNTWFMPLDNQMPTLDSVGYKIALDYFSALDAASESGRYGQADDALDIFKKRQREIAKNIIPSENLVAMEISYNKMNIFKNSLRLYISFGVLLLILFFIRVLLAPKEKRDKVISLIAKVFTALAVVSFLYHGYGIFMRWMISGHAPWSDGYEALVFIAFITTLVGLIFAKKNGAILAAALILSALMLYVSEMNLMDPEITNLQPVLKSYWLMIHVAIITGSYAPLGISFILGILNLVLYIVRTKSNADRLTTNINHLTYVSEMTMMIGVVMLTIGTFLGGIWANESWGRYWGWDPKETWALVAILVYAVILHFRFIPGLKGKFAFNAASVWGYSAILFTFFGVNFYLVGLHSYAQGDGMAAFPPALAYTIIIFVIFTIIAGVRQSQFKKQLKK